MPRIPPPIIALLKIQIAHLIKDGEKDLAIKLALLVFLLENSPQIIEFISRDILLGSPAIPGKSRKPGLGERISETFKDGDNKAKIFLIKNTVVALAKLIDVINSEYAYPMIDVGFQKIKVEAPKDAPRLPGDNTDYNEYWFSEDTRKIKSAEDTKYFKKEVKKVFGMKAAAESAKAKNKADADKSALTIEREKQKTIYNIERDRIIKLLEEEELKLIDLQTIIISSDRMIKESITENSAYLPQSDLDDIMQTNQRMWNVIPQFHLAHIEELREAKVSSWNTTNIPVLFYNAYIQLIDLLSSMLKIKIELQTIRMSLPEIPLIFEEKYPLDIQAVYSDFNVIDYETLDYIGPIEDNKLVNFYCLTMLSILNVKDILWQFLLVLWLLIVKIRIFFNEAFKAVSLFMRAKKTGIQVGSDSADYVSGTFQTVIVPLPGASVLTI